MVTFPKLVDVLKNEALNKVFEISVMEALNKKEEKGILKYLFDGVVKKDTNPRIPVLR